MAVTDIITGIYASTAILAAVQDRHRTGRGQHIDMALMDCAVSIMANQAMNYLATGTRRGGWAIFTPIWRPTRSCPAPMAISLSRPGMTGSSSGFARF